MTTGAPVRLGVLGCADIAWRKMLPAVAAEPRLRLVAVAGRDPARTELFARRFGARPVSGYADLLARDDIDAVYLPAPTGLHHRWARAALRAGRHVLCEKPLAGTAAEVDELVDLAGARGLVLLENVAFLLHSQHDRVRRVVADGGIGSLRSLRAVFGIPPLPADNVRYRPELGGGALLDVGYYPLRTAQLFLGPDLRLAGAWLRTGPTGVDVAGEVLVTTPDGMSAQLGFGFEHFYRGGYELWGSAGRLVLERAYTPPPAYQPVLRLETGETVQRRTLNADDQFAALARTFVDAVAGRIDLPGHHAEIRSRARLVDEIRRRAGQASP